MAASLKFKAGLMAAGLSCVLIGTAWAEQQVEREYEREGSPAQQSTGQQPGQIDQARQPGQQYTTQFRGTRPSAAGQNQQVTQFLAACLLAKNEAEVELGQLAQQQSQNPQVKQFAQKMVQDHRQLVQKLQPLAGAQASPSLGTTSQFDAQRSAADTTRLPGSPGAGQPTTRDTASDLSRNINQDIDTDRGPGQQNAAFSELAQIERQITERHQQAVRDELQQKQGAEFDKCYVGVQVAGHMHMVAALEVIEQQGPDQLRQIAQQARPTVEQHLEHAKQLIKQLEGSGSNPSQAERQQSRTQR